MQPLPSPSDEEVRALAARILERAEYGAWRGRPRIVSLLEWLTELWTRDPLLYWLLLGGLALVAALLLVHVAWAIRAALRMPAPAEARRPAREEPRLAEEAEGLAGEGRFLEAAQRLQLAVLERLLRARVVELARSDPNAILRRRLGAAPLPETERRELVTLIDRFERRWFRDRGEDPDLYAAWQALHARLAGVVPA